MGAPSATSASHDHGTMLRPPSNNGIGMSVASCSSDIDLWAKSVIRAMQGLQWRPIGFETQIDGVARP